MMEPKTGDEVHLVFATAGNNCEVNINGAMLPGVSGFNLQADVHGATKLTIDAFYPWPPEVAADETGKMRAKKRIFVGYFVARADWDAFDAWRKAQDA